MMNVSMPSKLVSTPILVNRELPFELMYDTGDYAIGVVLGQRKISCCMLFIMLVEL